ncbi:monovalent cation/H+ antiporter complex subunit F [Rothia aerolata]|uniref:Sodium:proton antiporter n=1 Tax=Rothia aerolata TaxID=1812262 RepID=A0A917IV44_9MICC|nr:monovalent cation/H+ antiporter complex subunit F [Rothia aerolata]GGH64070.1 hypothetical protein GCM10007359_16000 [Rothia aerolata]
MTAVLWIAGIMLVLASFGTLYRIFRGPTLLDRVLATDLLLSIFVAALCMHMIASDSYEHVLLLVAASTIGFVGSVTVARYAENTPSGEKKLRPSRLQEVNKNDPRSARRLEAVRRQAAARKRKNKGAKSTRASRRVSAGKEQ